MRLKAAMARAAADTVLDQAAGPLQPIVPPPAPLSTAELRTTKQGAAEPYTLIDSPAAWHGRDYQDRFDEWALQLTDQHIAELDDAVAAVLANKTIVQEGNYLNLLPPTGQPGQQG